MKWLASFLLLVSFSFADKIDDAEGYHRHSTMQLRVALEAIEQKEWIQGERILDLGCGDGKISAYLARRRKDSHVLGVDISSSMIEFARSLYRDEANVEFRVENGVELPFESEFDSVVSFSAIHWMMDQEKVYAGIYRALKPGGKIFLHTYGKGPMNVIDMAEALIQTKKWRSLFPNFNKQRVYTTKEDYLSHLQKAGFSNLSIEEFWNESPFLNRQAILDFVSPLLRFIDHLPEATASEFKEELIDRLLAVPGATREGVFYFKTLNLLAIGNK